MNIYSSSGAFINAFDVPSVIEKAQALEIKGIELSSGLKAGHDDLDRYLKTLATDFDLLLHNYFPAPDTPFVLNLASADDKERERAILFCQRAMALCVSAGSPFYSVHAGFVQALKPEDLGRSDKQIGAVTNESYERAMERFIDSINQLLVTAEVLAIDLLVENNVHAVPRKDHQKDLPSHLLLTDINSIYDFFSEVRHPQCGLLWDVAHWRIAGTHLGFDPVKEADGLLGWVRALHLSENNGLKDTNDICHEKSWFWPIVRALDSEIAVVLESYRLDDDVLQTQVNLLDKCLHS